MKVVILEDICLFHPLLLFGKKSLYTYNDSRGGKVELPPFLIFGKLIVYIFLEFWYMDCNSRKLVDVILDFIN